MDGSSHRLLVAIVHNVGMREMSNKKKTKTVWVLTYEVNEYNQDGEYFVTVWDEKPTIEKLAAYCSKEKISVSGDTMAQVSFLLHLLNGGGRQAQEHQWYYLNEVECEK